MTPISKELHDQIEREAEIFADNSVMERRFIVSGEARHRWDRVKEDYIKAATPYAAKFEQAKKALEEIADLQFYSEVNHPAAGHLQLIAKKALASWKEEGKAPEKKYPIGGYAPGNYYCKCCGCGKEFQGDKRAVECEPCAVKAKEAFDALSPDEQAELISRNAELAREFFSKQATEGKQEGGGHE